MQVIFETRFSFFGRSGWRSPVSADPLLLFDEERLARRFALFARLTLPSLVCQSDGEFRLIVLSSSLMPQHWQVRLRDLVHDVLGGRGILAFRPPRPVGPIMRRTVAAAAREAASVAQVVLDDDDAVSWDFVERLRRHAADHAVHGFPTPEGYFLSFPHGFTLGIEAGRPTWLKPRRSEFINLGLTLVGPPDTRLNPFKTSHYRIGERRPSTVVIERDPMWLRSVHDDNDSRARHQGEVLPHGEVVRALSRFPFLASEILRHRLPRLPADGDRPDAAAAPGDAGAGADFATAAAEAPAGGAAGFAEVTTGPRHGA